LINQIATTDQCFGLVLDDYHLIQIQEIHEAHICLLNNLPQKMRLVIATRTSPPLRLAQVRAQGALYEIRSEDLRFTTEESIRFLNQI
jgi:LuxR family maltose regulon positive regulatory protein